MPTAAFRLFMKIVKHVPAIPIILFVLLSFYDLLFNGWFEQPSIEVIWWEAGAGSVTLLVRMGFMTIAIFSSAIMLFRKPSNTKRVIHVLIILISPLLFTYSATGIERYSKSYDEDTFQQIVKELKSGIKYSKSSVLSALGDPLSKDSNATIWSYSYMPSCGYGWTKRTLTFDDSDKVTGWNNYSEP